MVYSFPKLVKGILADLPKNDYPALNARLFFECWLGYAMDKSLVSMRDLVKRLNGTGINVDISTFSKALFLLVLSRLWFPSYTSTHPVPGEAQGQWLDNQKTAEFLQDLRPNINKPTIVEIPEGLGQLILPDGSIIPATHALVVPTPLGGYKTAYSVPTP